MPSFNTYCLTWVSLTLGVGYVLTAAPPDLERGVAPLGPPVPLQPPLLGCGVASPGCRPWPRALGSSSQLLLRCRSLALSAATPDLGCGVAPPGRCPSPQMWVAPLGSSCTFAAWHSRPLPLNLGRGVAPLGSSCTFAARHSWLLPLTSDVG